MLYKYTKKFTHTQIEQKKFDSISIQQQPYHNHGVATIRQANTSTEVTYEDQLKINKFSTLISKKDEQTQQLSTLKTEKEYLDDLSIELELIDDDENTI